jgi:hypothetical protein
MNTISEASVLVLLMGVISEVYRWYGLSKFNEDWFGHFGNNKVITSTF